jgi:CCR4-NOT transcription complex subunit 1
VTTKQLITKDFAYEPDPDRFRESSFKIVKEMAGPLAQVTCREPLKASMNRSLKAMLAQSLTDATEIDIIIQKAVPDNLDFGCNLIKMAVVEQAEEVIKKDPVISQAIQLRAEAKAQGIVFKSELKMDIPAIVPEELRPRPGGLSTEEY